MALIDKIINYVVKLKYEDLPISVVEVTKRSVLDTLGIIIAGSSAQGCPELAKLVKGWGGKAEASILVYGHRVPAPNAALINSTMARACDLGDVHLIGGGHLSETTVPAAFVFAEYIKACFRQNVDGKSFILANVLCSDLTSRLRMAGGNVGIQRWRAETVAPIAVAAMGSKLFGFDASKLIEAMGIGYSQCCGNPQAIIDGALTVRLQQGLASRGGVLAVVLANIGFTGAKDIIEGEHSLYRLYNAGEPDADKLTGGLGERFEIENVSVKQYPSCGATHAAIEGVLGLKKEYGLKPDQVAKIRIITNKLSYSLCGFGENKKIPKKIVDAQFSYYYTAACAMVRDRVFIDDFTEAAIKDPEVLSLAQKIEVIADAEKDSSPEMVPPIDIEIKMKDNRSYFKTINFIKGHPNNPMSLVEVAQKLRSCARFSARPIQNEQIAHVIELVESLETLSDVTEMIKPLLKS